MSDNSKIEWTDATWNPITGCSVKSAGCKNCYAMNLAGTRLRHHPSRAGLTQDTASGPVWTGEVRLNEEWLTQPLKWKRPRRIFVCAHSDLFHDNVPDEWIDKVFAVMALCPQHTFQVLTKRPERMRDYCAKLKSRPLSNAWFGVTVENQQAANERLSLLLQTPAAVRWVSMEPLLERVDIAFWLDQLPALIDGRPRLDWVVIGGESGERARPMHPDWVRSLRDQCAAAGVPFMFKQWGEWCPRGPESWGYPSVDGVPRFRMTDAGGDGQDLSSEGGNDVWMNRAGKKAAGRLLDGVLHDAYPKVTA